MAVLHKDYMQTERSDFFRVPFLSLEVFHNLVFSSFKFACEIKQKIFHSNKDNAIKKNLKQENKSISFFAKWAEVMCQRFLYSYSAALLIHTSLNLTPYKPYKNYNLYADSFGNVSFFILSPPTTQVKALIHQNT